MKKITGLLAVLLCACWLALPAAAQDVAPVSTSCAAYIVVDADTGQVLLEKAAHEVRYPASVTKLMTMGLACQKAAGNWDIELTVSHEDCYSLELGSSNIALQEGEVVRLEDILYATEVVSANDAANMLASYVGGDIAGGVAAMNAQAQALGLENTHYMNPNGLHDEQHYTTAWDLARITLWALEQDGFETLFDRTDTWVMEPTNLQPNSRYFSISDHLRLPGYSVYRSYAKGSKSGWHDQAQYTQVTLAEQDGIRLIAVTLGSQTKNDKFEDTARLLDYCYANFAPGTIPLSGESCTVPVAGGGAVLGNVTLTPAQEISLLLPTAGQPGEVKLDYHIPDTYILGAAFQPTVTVTVAGTEAMAETQMTLPLEVSGLSQVLAASTYVRSPQEQKTSSLVALAVVAGVAVAALIIMLWRNRDETPVRNGKPVPQAVPRRPRAGSSYTPDARGYRQGPRNPRR